MFVGSLIFGVPLAAILCGWVMLYLRWRREVRRLRALVSMLMTTAPVILGSGALAYVHLVRPFPSRDYTVERGGILLSKGAVVAAWCSLQCSQRWIP
jgi:hypothetical protein